MAPKNFILSRLQLAKNPVAGMQHIACSPLQGKQICKIHLFCFSKETTIETACNNTRAQLKVEAHLHMHALTNLKFYIKPQHTNQKTLFICKAKNSMYLQNQWYAFENLQCLYILKHFNNELTKFTMQTRLEIEQVTIGCVQADIRWEFLTTQRIIIVR